MNHRDPPTPGSAEPRPISLNSPKAQLSGLGLQAKRSFGQNFLSDINIARRIAAVATPEDDTTVIEIGAGLGALTAPLLERASHVIAIERDRDLVPYLQGRFAGELAAGKLEVVEADAKAYDYAGAFSPAAGPCVLTGNLPYQITGPLLELTVQLAASVERAVYMVQLEVAERITAAPGTKIYGALSVFVQAAFVTQRALIVKRGAFHPQPGVDSAVIVLERRPQPIAVETDLFRKLVKDAFGARRKTLRNAWRGVGGEQLDSAAEAACIDLNLRGETLGVEAFAAMERHLLAARRSAGHAEPDT